MRANLINVDAGPCAYPVVEQDLHEKHHSTNGYQDVQQGPWCVAGRHVAGLHVPENSVPLQRHEAEAKEAEQVGDVPNEKPGQEKRRWKVGRGWAQLRTFGC